LKGVMGTQSLPVPFSLDEQLFSTTHSFPLMISSFCQGKH
jgi:hypothetical protein